MDSELISMVRLLPDEDALVQTAVSGGLLERGEGVLDELKEIISNPFRLEELSSGTGATASLMKKMISSRIRYLCREFSFRRLEVLCSDDYPSLGDVFLTISRIVDPELDVGQFASDVNSMAAQFVSEINARQTAVEQIEIFNHIFYHRLGFRAVTSPHPDDACFLVTSAVGSRRGTPLIILLIYFMMSRYADIDIFPMVFRAGVVPVIFERDKLLFFLDMNDEGKIIPKDDFLSSLAGAGIGCRELDVREDRILPVVYLESLLAAFSARQAVNGGRNAPVLVRAMERALSLFGPERFMTGPETDDEGDDE